MDTFCRGCLVQYNNPSELIQYTEKHRRLFIYCTGIQVKWNDPLKFQLCKDCYFNMKVSCKFKKISRNSDKKIKNYLALKETGDNIDFPTYLKNNDDSIAFRLPLLGNSTPGNNNAKDEDNESTCTSIQNFINDIMASEEIPATEARIIREVIEEEADVLDDSLDSHWLEDDASIDTNFKLDFSFSPFATPQYANEDNAVYTPKKFAEETTKKVETEKIIPEFKVPEDICAKNLGKSNATETKCIIDQNLENALQDENNENFYLDDLIVTPPLPSNVSGTLTPLITNILFGEKLESDNDDSNTKKIGQCIEEFNPVQGDADVLDDILAGTVKQFNLRDKEIKHDVEMKAEILKENNQKNQGKSKDIHKGDGKTKLVQTKCSSPNENEYSVTNFYCKMCNIKFKTLSALKVHCKIIHKLNIKQEKSQLGKVRICDYCGKIYHRVNLFIRHIKSHNKPCLPFVCKFCSLKFSTESKLKMHQTTHKQSTKHEDNKKKFVCTICGAGSSSATNLRTHLRRHSKSYTVHCEECGLGFYRRSDLTTHYRHHTGEKPFPCEYCTRSFARRDVLNRHMKGHTDEKPYACPYCNIRYAKNHELKAHLEKNKTCLENRNKSPSDENVDENNVSVYYATVVGTDVLVDDAEGIKEISSTS